MYIDPRLIKWIQDMYVFMVRQQEKMDRMEQVLLEMREDIRELKNYKRTNVEKIEYHFDQLKVEKLEGTLNIGLNPNGKEIEDLVIPQKGEVSEEQGDLFFPRLKEQLDRYIDQEIPREIRWFESNYGIELSEEFRHAIVEDIRNQVGPRIIVYMKKLRSEAADEGAVEKDILERVKRDIRIAIEQYFNKQTGKDSETE
ncbi:spore germination protein GerPC [Paenibacillus sp. J2TS4]|uniref:spore germination protein GerPC n=1 Tax=Paenibacillus sp. J2TS4 TaxID=2807194 RepID=UPI001B11FBD5|nr:spore germination protein GerPC [Paenibacillus sp. J2TS4]GIP33774.1 putative spore germination protein GerPC [Paenibacillus sp. J2TS4]